MKKFREKMAEKAGFTLVELIVVIAILAILAAVAVPAYTGYIKKANDAAVQTELSAVLTAAQAANATNMDTIDTISVSSDGKVTVTLKESGTLSDSYYQDFADLYGNGATGDNTGVTISGLSDKLEKSSYSGGATWASNTWTAVEGTSD